jgi:hypothetical protein
VVSSIRTLPPTELSSAVRSHDRNAAVVPRQWGGVPAPNLPVDRVEKNMQASPVHAAACSNSLRWRPEG